MKSNGLVEFASWALGLVATAASKHGATGSLFAFGKEKLAVDFSDTDCNNGFSGVDAGAVCP
jgi:hypothetical protein